MNELRLKVSPIFYALHESKARRVILQGGQWSGKTVNTLIYFAVKASTIPNLRLIVTAYSLPHLKDGAIIDFERFVRPTFAHRIKNHSLVEHSYTFDTGSIIQFKSYEDGSGPKRDYLFINEANKMKYTLAFELDSRTEIQTIYDYNPTAKFWLHEKIKDEPGTEFFISDHRHNPFLSEEKHREIEGIKDPELWRVYARGLTGNLQGTIFPEWNIIPDEQFPKDAKIIYGIDYGYTNDPTAIVKIARVGESLFLHECAYESGIPAKMIIQLLKANGYNNEPVYSEHDPDMISQIRRLGVPILMARKGQGSINAGIMKLKEYKVFMTGSSKNLKTEQTNYCWMNVDGKPINTPIDNFCHLIDATRYGVYTHYFKPQ